MRVIALKSVVLTAAVLGLAACSPPDKTADETLPADSAPASTDGAAMTPAPTDSTTTAGPAMTPPPTDMTIAPGEPTPGQPAPTRSPPTLPEDRPQGGPPAQ